jgi:transposase
VAEVENIQPDEPPPNVDVSQAVRDPGTAHMISTVVAAALCIKPRRLLTDRQARKVNALKDGSRAFAIMRGLAMRFNGILRSTSSQALDEWINDAIDTELTAIMRFATVLRRDIDAVKSAIELPWRATVRPKGRSTASGCLN